MAQHPSVWSLSIPCMVSEFPVPQDQLRPCSPVFRGGGVLGATEQKELWVSSIRPLDSEYHFMEQIHPAV